MPEMEERERLQKFVIGVRYLQLVFFSVLFFGIAMLCYDLIQLIPSVAISPWSIGCSIFGVEGLIASFLIIRSTERKIENVLQKERLKDGNKQ